MVRPTRLDIVFDLDLGHNAQSSKDRSSLFDGRLVSKPDEKIGKEILEWLDRGQQPASVTSSNKTPIFNESGFLTGEKETKAMMQAIQEAATTERLDSIDQSRIKGLSSHKLTEEQSKALVEAISSRRKGLPLATKTKAA